AGHRLGLGYRMAWHRFLIRFNGSPPPGARTEPANWPISPFVAPPGTDRFLLRDTAGPRGSLFAAGSGRTGAGRGMALCAPSMALDATGRSRFSWPGRLAAS